MKLISKITLLNFLITAFIFLLGGMAAYEIFMQQVRTETDYSLRSSIRVATQYIEDGLPYAQLEHEHLSIRALPAQEIQEEKIIFSDTLAYLDWSETWEKHRKLRVIQEINGQWYELEHFAVIIEAAEVFETIVRSLILLFAVLIIGVLLGNYWVSRQLLQPFYQSLHIIRHFNLKKLEKVHFPQTRTLEFQEMNEGLLHLIQRVEREYIALKEFSENASHEIQTPLAIAKGKLELLIQSPNLQEQEMEWLGSAYASLDKLSRLGQALTLLTKIDNREFDYLEPVNLSLILQKLLVAFEEIIDLKRLEVKVEIGEAVKVRGNTLLLDTMITNLLQNAVRHNHEAGKIWVILEPDYLLIANTGKALKSREEQLFQRFKKDQQSQKSLGLGLAIVKKIVEVHRFKIHYNFKERHELRIDFFE